MRHGARRAGVGERREHDPHELGDEGTIGGRDLAGLDPDVDHVEEVVIRPSNVPSEALGRLSGERRMSMRTVPMNRCR